MEKTTKSLYISYLGEHLNPFFPIFVRGHLLGYINWYWIHYTDSSYFLFYLPLVLVAPTPIMLPLLSTGAPITSVVDVQTISSGSSSSYFPLWPPLIFYVRIHFLSFILFSCILPLIHSTFSFSAIVSAYLSCFSKIVSHIEYLVEWPFEIPVNFRVKLTTCDSIIISVLFILIIIINCWAVVRIQSLVGIHWQLTWMTTLFLFLFWKLPFYVFEYIMPI